MKTIVESIMSNINKSNELTYDVLDTRGKVLTYNDLVKYKVFINPHPMQIKKIEKKLNSVGPDEYAIVFDEFLENGYDAINSFDNDIDGYLYVLDIIDKHNDIIFHIGIKEN